LNNNNNNQEFPAVNKLKIQGNRSTQNKGTSAGNQGTLKRGLKGTRQVSKGGVRRTTNVQDSSYNRDNQRQGFAGNRKGTQNVSVNNKQKNSPERTFQKIKIEREATGNTRQTTRNKNKQFDGESKQTERQQQREKTYNQLQKGSSNENQFPPSDLFPLSGYQNKKGYPAMLDEENCPNYPYCYWSPY